MSNQHFVKTKDKETALKLKTEGFTLLSNENGVYTFMNDGKCFFSDSDKKKLVYTNILNM